MSGKAYCSLYAFLESEHSELAALLDRLCLDESFKRTTDRTFLLPSSDLIKKISKKDPVEAVNDIRKLVLFKALGSKDDVTSATGNTMKEVIVSAEELKGNIGEKVKHNVWTKPGHLAVFKYTGTDVPKYTEGEKKSKPTKGKGVEGGAHSDYLKGLTKEINTKDNATRMQRYAKEVEKLLYYIKQHKEDIYKSMVFLLDHNPMVSWYIMVEPNEIKHKILSEDLLHEYGKFCEQNANNGATVMVPAEQRYAKLLDNVFTRAEVQPYMNKVNDMRKQLTSSTVLLELPKKTVEAYRNFISQSSNFPDGVDKIVEIYKSNPKLKLFHDELRYLYDPENKFFSDAEIVDNLQSTHFSNDVEKNLLLCNMDLYKHLLGPKHLLTCLDKFIKSTAFLYMPLDKETFDKHKAAVVGAGVSGGGDGCVIGLSGGSYRTGGAYTGTGWMKK